MFCIVLYNHSRACKIVLSAINRKGKIYVFSFVHKRLQHNEAMTFLLFSLKQSLLLYFLLLDSSLFTYRLCPILKN